MLQEQLFYLAHLSFIAPEESSYHGSGKLKFGNAEYPKATLQASLSTVS